MALIRFYQKRISPLKPPCCRFTPSCSSYALEAFEKRGCLVGFALMIWRILRCSPLSPSGYDPVPDEGFRTMPMRWSQFRKYSQEPPRIPLDEPREDETEVPQNHLNAKVHAENDLTNGSDEP